MMSAAKPEPFNAPRLVPPAAGIIRTWGAAFKNARIKAGYSYPEVAQFAGCSASVVRAWEHGEAFPNALQLKSVYAHHMHVLRAFAHLLPSDTQQKVAAIDVQPVKSVPAPPPPEAPEPMPRKFAAALRWLRLEEGMHQHEVGELIGVHATSVSGWELGNTTPIQSHYEKLVEIFPALGELRAPSGCRDIIKPGRPPGEQMAAPAPTSMPALPPIPPPPPVTTLEAAGAAYARALGALTAARVAHQEALDRAKAAELAVQEAQRAVTAANEELQAIATRGGTP